MNYDHLSPLERQLVEALEGVVRVADRATDEFDAARAAIAAANVIPRDRPLFTQQEVANFTDQEPSS